MNYRRSLDISPGIKNYMWESEIDNINIVIWGSAAEPNQASILLAEYVVKEKDKVCGLIRQILSYSFECSKLIELESITVENDTNLSGAMATFRIIGSAEDSSDYPFVEFTAETNGDTVYKVIVSKV